MRVVDLKAELKTRGLPVSGLKAVLIQRLQDHDNSLAVSTPHDAGKNAEGDAAASTVTAVIQADDTNNNSNATEVKPSIETGAGASAAVEPATSLAGKHTTTTAVEGVPSPPTTAAKEEPLSPEISSAGGVGTVAPMSPAAADPPHAATTTTISSPVVLKSTRSKTRRASMANAAAAAVPTPVKPEAEVKPEVSVTTEDAPAPAAPASSTVEAIAEGGTSGSEGVEVEGGALDDDNSAMQIRLAKGSGIFGVVISAACVGLGHGLTAGNLVNLHVRT